MPTFHVSIKERMRRLMHRQSSKETDRQVENSDSQIRWRKNMPKSQHHFESRGRTKVVTTKALPSPICPASLTVHVSRGHLTPLPRVELPSLPPLLTPQPTPNAAGSTPGTTLLVPHSCFLETSLPVRPDYFPRRHGRTFTPHLTSTEMGRRGEVEALLLQVTNKEA